ncbi:MAG: cell division protein ZapA [Balneolaceae bacterium]
MKSIKVTILGKQYPLKVADDEVQNMQRIARFVDEKFRLYKQEFSKQPETTIMVLAALSIAEELFETRNKAQSGPDQKEMIERMNRSIKELMEETF